MNVRACEREEDAHAILSSFSSRRNNHYFVTTPNKKDKLMSRKVGNASLFASFPFAGWLGLFITSLFRSLTPRYGSVYCFGGVERAYMHMKNVLRDDLRGGKREREHASTSHCPPHSFHPPTPYPGPTSLFPRITYIGKCVCLCVSLLLALCAHTHFLLLLLLVCWWLVVGGCYSVSPD